MKSKIHCFENYSWNTVLILSWYLQFFRKSHVLNIFGMNAKSVTFKTIIIVNSFSVKIRSNFPRKYFHLHKSELVPMAVLRLCWVLFCDFKDKISIRVGIIIRIKNKLWSSHLFLINLLIVWFHLFNYWNSTVNYIEKSTKLHLHLATYLEFHYKWETVFRFRDIPNIHQ